MGSFEGFRSFLENNTITSQNFLDTEIVSLYLHNPTTKVSELASQAGISLAEFYRVLNKYSVKPCRLGGNQEVVQSCSDAGYSTNDIAKLTGYTPRNVRYILTKYKQNYRGFDGD